jgi:predicted transcriptional regulator
VPIADVMDSVVITVDLNDSVFDVQQLMRETGRWAVPVVEEGFYRGIFTTDRFGHVYRSVNGQTFTAKAQRALVTRLAEFRGNRTRASRDWWRRLRA